jgi:hypothetical protein
MSAPTGAINGYQCEDCGKVTMTIHVEEGTTPMFLACRAEGLEPEQSKCKGQAVSLGYPENALPDYLKEALRERGWEWHKAGTGELLAMGPEEQSYVKMGGLLLRRITKAGLDLIPGDG